VSPRVRARAILGGPGRFDARDRLFDQAFDGAEIFPIRRHRERDRDALAARAARAPDPVHVILGMDGTS
jgi:hypothetical protein